MNVAKLRILFSSLTAFFICTGLSCSQDGAERMKAGRKSQKQGADSATATGPSS